MAHRSPPSSSPVSLVALLAMVAAGACSSPEPTQQSPAESTPAAHEDVGTTSQAITSADVIARAEQWSDAKLLYCQSANHKPDYDSACPSTCNRQNNPQWDPYRSDCSGLISWAWGLPPPGRVTSGFAPYNTSVSKKIAWSDLAPGDALNSTPDEHIVLFKEWKTKGSSAVFIEEPGCSSTPNYAHEYTASVSVNSDGTLHVEGMNFWPIRFDSIVQQAPDYAAEFVSQSWPYASAAPIQLTAGQPKKGSIDFKNIGAKTWKSGVVKLAPIPRDKDSNLAASSWLSPTRVSSVTGDVAPGAVGHFEWDLEGSQAGDFKPFFGLVAEGITWFAQSGGPADDVIQVSVHVTAAPPSGTGGTSGTAGSPGSAGSPAKGGAAGAPSGAGTGGQASAGSAGKSGGTGGASAGAGGASAGGAKSAGGSAGAKAGTAGTSSAGASGATSTGSAGSTGEGTGGAGGDGSTDAEAPTSASAGGCAMGGSSSGGAGSALIFALLGLGLRRRRRESLVRRGSRPIRQGSGRIRAALDRARNVGNFR